MNQRALEATLKPILKLLESAFPDAKPTCELCQMLNDEIENILGDNNLTPLMQKIIISACESDHDKARVKIEMVVRKLTNILEETT